MGKIEPWNKGKGEYLSSESRKKQREKTSLAMKGRMPHNIELLKQNAVKFKKGQKVRLGKMHTEESRMKMSKTRKDRDISKNLWNSKEYRKKVLGRRDMSSLEKKMLRIIQKHNLPYKFVGDGQFSIGRKVPDFINCNGKKIAVEVFYPKHKEQFRAGGLEGWKESRSKEFAKYGWSIEYFDVMQVNEEEILRRIG